MSLSTIKESLRVALWLAYVRRCAYCSDPLAFRDLEIDHLIPESLCGAKLSEALMKFGLPSTFDLNSPLNLFPIHHRCNSMKSNWLFAIGPIHFYLEIARKHQNSIAQHLTLLDVQKQKGKILGLIGIALEAGSLTPSDIDAYLRPLESIRVNSNTDFSDGSTLLNVSNEDVELLLNKHISFGGRSSNEGLEFTHTDESRTVIHTCSDYRRALAKGYFADTTYAMKMEVFLSSLSAILHAAVSAKVADISYLDNPRVGVSDLDLLSTSLLPGLSPDYEQDISDLGDVTLQALVRSKVVSILGVSSNHLQLEWNGAGAVVNELLRADFDDDGLSEILIQYYTYAVEGTLGVGSVGVLKRLSSNSLFIYTGFEPSVSLF